jgi:hypothetical protein
MSSLQKFHRRTNGGAPAIRLIGSEAPVAGAGFYLGFAGDGTSYMYVAPKSTEVQTAWGSRGTVRNTTSTTNGVANTTTLFNLGDTAHPAAYYAKSLTTGGYNTWYLPAKDELNTLYSNKSAVPNGFVNYYYWSSTEFSGQYAAVVAWFQDMTNGNQNGFAKNDPTAYVRATRRSII